MKRKVILLRDASSLPTAEHALPPLTAAAPDGADSPADLFDTPLLDTRGRPLRDLRISVTDRCNFRCSYCMPKEVFDKQYSFLPHSSLLSFEEITRVARLFVQHGVRKIRLTGGEPLLRQGLATLVGLLRPIPGIADLALTTNGLLLARQAAAADRPAGDSTDITRPATTNATPEASTAPAPTYLMYALQIWPGLISDSRNGAPVAGLLVMAGWIGGSGTVITLPSSDSNGSSTSQEKTPPANMVPAILGPMT